MRDLADFLPHVLPHALACPEPVALKYLREACQEWCVRTREWRETDSFPTSGGEFEVLCIPPYAALHELEDAAFDGRPLDRLAYGAVFPLRQDDTGPPRAITQVSPNSVILVPPGKGTLAVSMWLKPAEDAECVPHFLFDLHARAIAWGALAAIKMLPGQPFSDPNAAIYFAQRFESAVLDTIAAPVRGQQRAAAHVRARYF